MSPRRRRRAQAPPPLPQARQVTPMQRRLNMAVPYIIVVVVVLPIIAYIHHRITTDGADFALAFPRGEWGETVREVLLWGLLPLTVLALVVWVGLAKRVSRTATFKYSRVWDARALGLGLRARLASLPNALRVLAVMSWLMALMGPELKRRHEVDEMAKGIDIMVVLDVSGSMQARDLHPNRLNAAKRVIDEFISRRKSDRIGLVLFAKEAYWWCPLTLDYDALRTMLSGVRLGVVNPRGTAIGDAIGTALNRLRRSKTKTKVIILLTDGDNNSGILMPRKAAQYARTLNVKVYTILMGYKGRSAGISGGFFRTRYPVNPRLLEEIAATTGGTPYLAGDTPALRNRFQKILDSLEKDRLPARFQVSRQPIHGWFVTLGIVFLVLELLLSLTVFRRFP